jgi:hypothetical protein
LLKNLACDFVILTDGEYLTLTKLPKLQASGIKWIELMGEMLNETRGTLL